MREKLHLSSRGRSSLGNKWGTKKQRQGLNCGFSHRLAVTGRGHTGWAPLTSFYFCFKGKDAGMSILRENCRKEEAVIDTEGRGHAGRGRVWGSGWREGGRS